MSERQGFRCGRRTLIVDVSVEDAVGPLRALFPDDRVDPGGAPADFTVVPDDEGYRILTPAGSWLAPELPDLLTRLELLLAESLVVGRGLTGVHASGVALGRGAVLFAGPGGSGKSSLAAAFALRGHGVFGDDVVFLEGSVVHPFRRLMKVEEPARSLLGLPDPLGPLAGMWDDAALYHPSELGSSWADPGELRAVVLASRRAGPPDLRRTAPAGALAELLTGIVMRPRVGTESFEEMAAVVERTPCYALAFGDTADAVGAVLGELA